MFVSDVCCTYVICMFHMFIYMLQVTCPNVAYACSAFFLKFLVFFYKCLRCTLLVFQRFSMYVATVDFWMLQKCIQCC
jgi:hypothetical protein